MGHVNVKIGTNKICNLCEPSSVRILQKTAPFHPSAYLSHSGKVNVSRISTCTSNKNLWSVKNGIGFKSVIINVSGLLVKTVRQSFKVAGYH